MKTLEKRIEYYKKRKKRRDTYFSLVDLYDTYPCKKAPDKVMGRNWIPLNERIEDHQHSLTLAQYKEICKALFNVIIDYVLDGYTFNFPFGLGQFFMVKYPNLTTWKDFSHTNNQKVGVRWKKTVFVANAYAWEVIWTKNFKEKMKQRMFNDRHAIDNYRNRYATYKH